MTPFEIVFVACLVANMDKCETHRVPYESAGSIKQCTMEAQGPVAQWAGEHEDQRVTRFGCEINGVKMPSNG